MESTRPTDEQLADRFTYHPPTEVRAAKHEMIREMLLAVGESISANVPPGRELSLTLTKLEEAMFWANAALARTP